MPVFFTENSLFYGHLLLRVMWPRLVSKFFKTNRSNSVVRELLIHRTFLLVYVSKSHEDLHHVMRNSLEMGQESSQPQFWGQG